MSMKKKAITFFILVATGIMPVLAQSSSAPAAGANDDEELVSPWYKRHREGWWWGNESSDKPKPPPAPVPAPKAPTADAKQAPAQPKTEAFSAVWLRENLPKLLDKAIDNPSQENVAAYLYAQRALLDKSQNFENSARLVIATDPMLDENNRVPIASFARAVADRKSDEGITEGLKYLAQKAGLWVFYDSSCLYCQPQVDIVNRVARQSKMPVQYIALDGKPVAPLKVGEFVENQGAAQSLGITMTPTTVLVVPPNGYYIISQGLMAESDLRERIVTAAQAQNLLPKEVLAKVRVFDRGVLSPKDLESGASKDPAEIVRIMRQKLKGVYANEPQ